MACTRKDLRNAMAHQARADDCNIRALAHAYASA
jgi:hypothetical protein